MIIKIKLKMELLTKLESWKETGASHRAGLDKETEAAWTLL